MVEFDNDYYWFLSKCDYINVEILCIDVNYILLFVNY